MAVIGKIPMSVDKLKEWIAYDPINGEFIWKKSPHHSVKAGDRAGHMEKRGYWILQVNRNTIKGHRAAWAITYGYFPTLEIDHIDNNPSNNRIDNLREVDRSKNQMNSKPPKNNSSGVKGVSYCNPKKKWIAAISINKKKICIGHFNRFEDAVQARMKKEKEIHGEYAFKN
jgi:hypothetical protein